MKIPPILISILFVSCAGKKLPQPSEPPQNTIVAAASTVSNTGSSVSNIDSSKAFSTPGNEHKMLASWNGTWAGEISFQDSFGKPATKGISIITNRMILGGRYQISNQKGTIGNNAFEGVSTLGFDNQKKQFVSTWIDNMGTSIIMLQGPWNETTKTINLSGMQTDPKSGKERNIHETLRIIDNNRQLMEIFQPGPDGKELKTMEVLYTRKSR